MDIKLLKKGYKISLEIASKQEVLKELKSSLGSLKAIKLSEKVQGGNIPDDSGIISKINKIIQLEKEIENLCNLQFELSEAIDRIIDINERSLLRFRYITSLTWEIISDKMGYSMSQTKRIHRDALHSFGKL